MPRVKAEVCPLEALNKNVILRRAQSSDMSAGGIVLPDIAKDKLYFGTILAVGKGCAASLEPGREVFFSRYEGHDVEVAGEKFFVVKEENLLAARRQ